MEQSRHMAVALDGPSAAGKSTLARAAARRFGFLYVDTGAIYRSVGLAACRAGIDPKDTAAVMELLPGLRIDMAYDERGVQRMLLDGEDVSEEIRRPEISLYASDVSAHPEVRAFLMEMQRDLARRHSVVMDGRDIGTVVLPDAELKVFLTASAAARARRRWLELREKGIETDPEEVRQDIAYRDQQDTRRAAAPLRPAEDAVFLDTSELSLEQSVEALCGLIREAMER
ncbi:MAG: (d)CMP kinase [Oscillospiraceae bacterium]|nr:(d)CMP kinase [Oscillospiraceae bacterium]